MKISSPPNLHYPVTVGEIAASVNDVVKRSDPLFTYFYETTIEEGNKWGETIQVKKKFPVRFEASLGGIIKKWYIKTGAVIHRPGVNLVDIEEPCSHEIQFGGLCAECGLDMTEMDYQTQELNSDRAKINMTHGSMALLISQKEAVRAEEDSKKRLLSAKKLSLIVDLDQTVIHTTCERTIAEWQADPDNPNYGAVKDVKGFQLADDNAAHIVASWYYVKMRPGLKNFFEQMSKLYEMHIYTMATRAYAEEVARIIDPQRKYFGERILSRDENYGEKLKSLNRLFPNNTDMAVIIDDRADIWSYCENLVRVPVFNFFPGAGDINASFLPKQQELVTQTQTPKAKTADVTATPEGKAEDEPAIKLTVGAYPIETETKTKPAEPSKDALNDLEQQLISMGAGKGTEALELQVKEQEKVIIEQQTERPLLQQQLVLDKEDEEAEVDEVTQTVENGSTQNTDHHKHRHGVLHDDDRGLEVIEAHLRLVHQTFYEEYQKNKVVPHGGRVAELKGYKSPKKRPLDDVVPDVAEIMPRLKRETLSGCVIVFSGIIPLGVDVQNSDFALWVKSFGAKISTHVNKFTTHVIANPEWKTTKVKKAARFINIQIVTAEWMFQCCTRWEHVDEGPYLIEMGDADRDGSPMEDGLEDGSFTGDESVDGVESPKFEMSDDMWSSLNNELDDFLNESDDTDGASASDSDSVRSTDSGRSEGKTKKKRKRGSGVESNDGSEADDSDASVKSASSKLQRKKKRTMERVTSLTAVENAERTSGLPSPETTGPEEEQGDEEGKTFDPQGEGPDLDSDFDDGLEAAMMDEFEKSGNED